MMAIDLELLVRLTARALSPSRKFRLDGIAA
jgi:hypothetical protein